MLSTLRHNLVLCNRKILALIDCSLKFVFFDQVSDGLFEYLKNSSTVCVTAAAFANGNVNQTAALGTVGDSIDLTGQQLSEYSLVDDLNGEECVEEVYFKFKSMQYSLFTNFGVEIIGGVLFFITAIFIVRDKLKCENASAGELNYFLSLCTRWDLRNILKLTGRSFDPF